MAGFEIVVIGGGVTGSSIAYHLARQGRQVLVIERSSPAVEPAASWASAGGVRRQPGRVAARPRQVAEVTLHPVVLRDGAGEVVRVVLRLRLVGLLRGEAEARQEGVQQPRRESLLELRHLAEEPGESDGKRRFSSRRTSCGTPRAVLADC